MNENRIFVKTLGFKYFIRLDGKIEIPKLGLFNDFKFRRDLKEFIEVKISELLTSYFSIGFEEGLKLLLHDMYGDNIPPKRLEKVAETIFYFRKIGLDTSQQSIQPVQPVQAAKQPAKQTGQQAEQKSKLPATEQTQSAEQAQSVQPAQTAKQPAKQTGQQAEQKGKLPATEQTSTSQSSQPAQPAKSGQEEDKEKRKRVLEVLRTVGYGDQIF